MTGTLEQTERGWRLNFVRHLNHPPEKVWTALTEPDQLGAWFPDTMSGDPTVVGSQLTFSTQYESVPSFHGTVLTVEPPRLLEFTWGEDTLRFEIEATDDGCTLTLRDSIAELGKGARDGAGWHVCLDQLEASLAGAVPKWSPEQRWTEIHPDYVAAFGPDAATVGPPADLSSDPA
ncbi:MAG: hypothetical protein JWP39_3121 [Jatrophihabitans sp.]|nr:hypothetical protein [Jatrophihabitans sp.]